MGNNGAPGFGHQILGSVDFPSTEAKSSRRSLCRSSGTRSGWQGWDGENPSSIMSEADENNDEVGVLDVDHSCSVSTTLKSFSRRHRSSDRANLYLNQTLQNSSTQFNTFHPKMMAVHCAAGALRHLSLRGRPGEGCLGILSWRSPVESRLHGGTWGANYSSLGD